MGEFIDNQFRYLSTIDSLRNILIVDPQTNVISEKTRSLVEEKLIEFVKSLKF